MKIVIDSNRVFAALLKENTTRKILFCTEINFYAPDCITIELGKYKQEILKKLDLNEEEYEILLSLIFENITIVPIEEYSEFVRILEKMISDPKDIPYLALAISLQANGIWTHDPHFKEQTEVKIFTNIDLLRREINP